MIQPADRSQGKSAAKWSTATQTSSQVQMAVAAATTSPICAAMNRMKRPTMGMTTTKTMTTQNMEADRRHSKSSLRLEWVT